MLGIVPGAALPDPVRNVGADRGDHKEDVEELHDVVQHLPNICRMSDQYHFVTEWRFRAPLERVWSIVLDLERYPGRWKNFRRVKVISGDGRSVGSMVECTVRGSLPYSLTYTIEVVESEKYRHILVRSTGSLVGTGRWAFSESEPGVSKAVTTGTSPRPIRSSTCWPR